MAMRTYSALQIAKFFLSLVDLESNDISNMKLQKLCYYAQGICSSMRGDRLFHDKVVAWDHGPVIPEVYHIYKRFGAQPITPDPSFDAGTIDESDRAALEALYQYYGQFSAWRLRNMTHDEAPWRQAYDSASGSEIAIDDLTNFFQSKIDEDFVRRTYGEEFIPKVVNS